MSKCHLEGGWSVWISSGDGTPRWGGVNPSSIGGVLVYTLPRDLDTVSMPHGSADLQCLPQRHIDDIKGCARKEVAESLLGHLDKCVGQRKAYYTPFLHTGIQHEHSPGAVFTHQYIGSIVPISSDVFIRQSGRPGVEWSSMIVIGPSLVPSHGLHLRGRIWPYTCKFSSGGSMRPAYKIASAYI